MYKEKYLKYKIKYTALKNQLGGNPFSFLEQGITEPYYEKINYFLKIYYDGRERAPEENNYIIYYSPSEIKLVSITVIRKDTQLYESEVSPLHLTYDNEQFIITLFIQILDQAIYRVIQLKSIADITSLYNEIIVQLETSSDQIGECKKIIRYLILIKRIMYERRETADDHEKLNELITLLNNFIKEFTKLINTIKSKSDTDINEEKQLARQTDERRTREEIQIQQVKEYPLIQPQDKLTPFEEYKELKIYYRKIDAYENQGNQIYSYVESRKHHEQRKTKEISIRKQKAERYEEGELGNNDYRDDDEY
jgi:hypothetical protein